MTTSIEDTERLHRDMASHFGEHVVPNPVHYPNTYSYYVGLYKRYLESRERSTALVVRGS